MTRLPALIEGIDGAIVWWYGVDTLQNMHAFYCYAALARLLNALSNHMP